MPGAQDRWDQLTEVNARKQEAPQPHDPPRTAERPERGSLVDLRRRLERLPAGHPSSPYNDDLSRKPAVAQLKDLELPVQGYERDGYGEAKHSGTEQAPGALLTDRTAGALRSEPPAGSLSAQPAASALPAESGTSALSAEPDVNALLAEPDVKALSAQPDANALSADPAAGAFPAEPDVNALPGRPTASALYVEPVASALPAEPDVNALPVRPTASALYVEPVASAPSAEPGVSALPAERDASALRTEEPEPEVVTGSNGHGPTVEKVSAADWRSPAGRDSTGGWEGAQEADSLVGLTPLPEPDFPAGWPAPSGSDSTSPPTPAPAPDAVPPWTADPSRPPEPSPPPEPDLAQGWISAPVSNGVPDLAPSPELAPAPELTPVPGLDTGSPWVPKPDSLSPDWSPGAEPSAAPPWAPEPDSPQERSPEPRLDVPPPWAPNPEPVASPAWAPEPDGPAGLAAAAEPAVAAPWTNGPDSPSGLTPAPAWGDTFDPENTGEWRTAPDPENTGEWRTISTPGPADRAAVVAPERVETRLATETVHHTAPDLKQGPGGDEARYGSDGSWEWNGRYLTPMQSQMADTALSRNSAAEGKNVFGGYGHSGLTPAMRRIEAQLERGQLLPDTENYALKTPDGFKESFADLISRHPDKTAEELSHEVHDGIRYAYIFENDDYSDATLQVHSRLKSQGFELEARRNIWKSLEYKGINTRWRDPAHDLVFEVQFHTPSSWDAKQRMQRSFRRIKDPATPPAERVQLRTIQAKTSAVVPVPPGAASIPDYRKNGQ